MASNKYWPASYWGELIKKVKGGPDFPTPKYLGDLTQYETILDDADAQVKAYEALQEEPNIILITTDNRELESEWFGGYPNKPPHK